MASRSNASKPTLTTSDTSEKQHVSERPIVTAWPSEFEVQEALLALCEKWAVERLQK